jgi:zinc transport system substrate-binding protein
VLWARNGPVNRLFFCFRCVILLTVCCLGACRRQQTNFALVNKLSIVATVYPVADIARQIAGDYADVSWVVEGGQSLAAVQPSTELNNRLSAADLVISTGVTEPWANAGFSDPLQQQHVLRLDLLPSTGGPADGFLWLDPLVAKNLVNELCVRLTVMRPEQSKYFIQRRDAYLAQLDGLLGKYQPLFAAAQNRQVLVLSSDFNALLGRFGLYPLEPAAASPLQLDESDIAAIRRMASDKRTHLLLVSTETPEVVARDLDVRAGVQVVRIDCLGSSAADGHNNYLDLMRYDLDQLLSATGAQ